MELNCLEHGLAFNYQKTIYRLDKNDSLLKNQGEYHQKMRDETINALFEKVEKLDSYAMDYKIQITGDEKFENLIRSINQWPRPDFSRFVGVKTITELNKQYELEVKEKRNFTSDYWFKATQELDSYISGKLL